MKWVWIILACVVVGCGVCGTGAFLLGRNVVGEIQNAQADAKVYGDESLKAITQPWNSKNLISRAAPEFLDQVGLDKTKEIVEKLSTIGNLKSFSSEITSIRAMTTTEAGQYTEAKYVANCKFEKGDQRIEMTLILRNGKWTIIRFYGYRDL